MVSLPPKAGSKLISTHGKILLNELSLSIHSYSHSSTNFETLLQEKLKTCLDIISKDKNACLLKFAKTGNTAFHLLVGSDYPQEFIIPLLKRFIEVAPIGLSMKNSTNNLPLHFCLSQRTIFYDVAVLLIKSYPEGCGIQNNSHLIPLFLAVMRNDPSFELCKLICQSFPESPQTSNQTLSLPLHFVCKRKYPNLEVLRMLLKRYPEGASVVNSFGLLPLHCLSSFCEDIRAFRMVYEAFQPAVKIIDRQGRTCLHLAVLAVGKDHTASVKKEKDEEMQLLRENTVILEQENNSDQIIDTYDDEDDIDNNNRSELYEHNTKFRMILRELISWYPQALIIVNNFQSIPVDTVIEKTKINPKLSKYKTVKIFGLYNDPPTARLLLLCHQYFARIKNCLPILLPRYVHMLQELNWIARRDALFVSLIGETKYGMKIDCILIESMKKLKITTNNNNNNNNNNRVVKGSNKSTNVAITTTVTNELKDNNNNNKTEELLLQEIPKNNLLARLRRSGHLDCVRLCISWI